MYFYKTICSIHGFEVKGNILTFESNMITWKEYDAHLFKISSLIFKYSIIPVNCQEKNALDMGLQLRSCKKGGSQD